MDSIKISMRRWLHERIDNCLRIAPTKNGEEAQGWLEDAEYYRRLAAQEELGERLADDILGAHDAFPTDVPCPCSSCTLAREFKKGCK